MAEHVRGKVVLLAALLNMLSGPPIFDNSDHKRGYLGCLPTTFGAQNGSVVGQIGQFKGLGEA